MPFDGIDAVAMIFSWIGMMEIHEVEHTPADSGAFFKGGGEKSNAGIPRVEPSLLARLVMRVVGIRGAIIFGDRDRNLVSLYRRDNLCGCPYFREPDLVLDFTPSCSKKCEVCLGCP